MDVEFIPAAGNLKRIESIWKSLEKDSDVSFFLSWGWIENWIESLPEHVKPELVVFFEEKEPQLAFFLGKANLNRKKIFTSRGWFVNTTGIPSFDRIHIEYNGFLHKNHQDLNLMDLLIKLPADWDEFYIPGIDIKSFAKISSHPDAVSSFRTVVDSNTLSPYVDLEMIRGQGGNYFSLLSANKRQQIKRSYRLAEKTGMVRLEVAHDLDGALDIYNEMVFLHEKVWTERGKEGAFSSDYLFQFHRRLIQNRFNTDEIQLLRIKCGEKTLGCLYNFVYRKNVYFYQSGINYDLDKRLMPGFMIHVEAIRHNVTAGHRTYDFLGGDSDYKMSLATHHNRLIWARLQKPRLKFMIENTLKKVKHFVQPRQP